MDEHLRAAPLNGLYQTSEPDGDDISNEGVNIPSVERRFGWKSS
jgi:hypothetical protein